MLGLVYLYNVVVKFFLVERNLKQELQGKETSDKSDHGEFDHQALLHLQAVLHILLLPLLPPSPPHHYHPPSSPPHPSPSPPPSEGLEGLQAIPPLLQGPVGKALGFQAWLASSSPQVSK